MSPEVLLVLLVLAAIVSLFAIVNFTIKHRARDLISFVNELECDSDVDPYFWEYADGGIFFEKAFLVGKINVDGEGIFLHAKGQFNSRLPWEIISAIGIVELNGDKVANLRIATSNGIDRRLSMQWMDNFSQYVPEAVAIVRG